MISVVITAYNVGQYIEQAIRSVLEQTYKDLEVIVVLDKPTDNTEEVVRSVAKEDSRVCIVSNDVNVGAGLSRRYGLQKAKGEYTLLLDGDDYLHPDFLQALHDRAEETCADIVSGGIEVLREDGVRDITLYGNVEKTGHEKVTHFWGERIVFMNNKLIRRNLHELVPYCHRRYIEDTPVIIPQLWYANKVAYTDNAGYVYRMQPNSLTHTTNPVKDVIFKGLCWCDLMDFFNEHDPGLMEAFPLKQYVTNVLNILNGMTLTADELNPYGNEWAELAMRLVNLVRVTGIDFKEYKPKKVSQSQEAKSRISCGGDNSCIELKEGVLAADVKKCGRTTLCAIAYREHNGKLPEGYPDREHGIGVDDMLPYYRAADAKALVKFAVWRDPVKRLVSFYTNKLLEARDIHWYYALNGLRSYSSFDDVIDFAETELRKPVNLQEQHVRRQCDSYNVEDMTDIVKIERLDDFVRSLGIEPAPHLNCTKGKIYQPSAVQVERIKRLYAADYKILESDKMWYPQTIYEQDCNP